MNTTLDLFFKNFFDASNQTSYLPIGQTKLQYPVDIYLDSNQDLVFEIACTGIPKDEIDVKIQGNQIQVEHTAAPKEDITTYIHKSIAKRSFNLGWRISDLEYKVSATEASFDLGLLTLRIPKVEMSKSKTLIIK